MDVTTASSYGHENNGGKDEPDSSSVLVPVGIFGVLFYLLLWRIALRDFTIIGLTQQNTLGKVTYT